MPSSPVADLTARLDSLRAGVRRLYALHGAGRVVLLAAAVAVTTFVLDWSIPDLPGPVRLVFLAIGLAALAWAGARYVLYPLRRPLTDDDLAICVEREFPDLGDRLISAIQLSRAAGQPGWETFNSPVLVDALIADARDAAARLDFRRVIAPRRAWTAAALAGLSVAALAGTGALFPNYASIWFHRLLGGPDKWPQQTYLTVVDPPVYVARGDDCPITVRARGSIPKRVTVAYRFAGGEQGAARMDAAPNNEFKFEFAHVLEPFRFRVRGGDDETEEFAVDVKTAPALETLVKWYRYPAHLPLENTPADRPEPGGNIKAPVGTVVRIQGTANGPLAAAQFLYVSQPDKPKPLAIEPDAKGVRRVVTGTVDVRGNDEYRIVLTGENTLANREPIRFSIIGVPDNPPVIRVIEPGADRIATKEALWPLETSTTDDFGLRQIRLVWWVIAQSAGPEHVVEFTTQNANDVAYKATRITSTFPFDLAKTDAKDREQVAYRFEALDFDASKPKPAQTRVFHFTIWPRAELEKRIEEDMNRLKEELRRILEAQRKILTHVTALRDALQAADALEPARKGEIKMTALDQRQKVGQRIERATRDLQESIKTVRFNRLLDAAALDKMERLHGLLDAIARRKSPEAAHAVDECAGARSPAERRDRFDQSLAGLNEIVADLEQALSMLEDWMTYQEIVRRWREVRTREEEIYKQILDLLQKGGAAPPKR